MNQNQIKNPMRVFIMEDDKNFEWENKRQE